MAKEPQRSVLMGAIALALACGPRVENDDAEAADASPDVVDGQCEDGSCPLACGDRPCAGALGMGWCIDDKCSPVPMECVVESRSENDCKTVCEGVADGFVCVENGCEGATAFGYPGPATQTIAFCGESTPEIQEAVVYIEGPCDAPLVFTGEGSFELYQCCCDDPAH